MDIVFRRILHSSPREAPPGEIHIRALEPDHDSALANLALAGVAGFVGGTTPNATSFVMRDNPTLDEMLALLFLQNKPRETAAAQRFADYAKKARAGLYPSRQGGCVIIPVERSLEAVFELLRHNAAECAAESGQPNGTLADRGCRARFLADWNRLSALILRKIAENVDPHRQPLFDDSSEFDEELAFLEKDHETYRRERDAGEIFLVEMKQRGVEKPCPSLPALVLKGRSSYLLVPFSRSDPESPDGKKFQLLCVKDPEQGWVISTEPTDKYDLKPLAEQLQKLEDAATPAGEPPHIWRDGKPHKHTIVFAPETGSRLSDEAVVGAIKKWGRAKPVSKVASRTSATNVGRWPRIIPAAVVLVGGFLAWKYWPVPPPPPASSNPKPAEQVVHAFARGNAPATIAENVRLIQRLLPRGNPTLTKDKPTEATFVLNNPGGEPRRIQVRLEYTSFKDVPPPRQVEIRSGTGPAIPVTWQGPDSNVWTSQEFREVVVEGEKPAITVTAKDSDGPDRDFGIELCWRPDYKMHLYFLAIGVGAYGEKARVPTLECPAGDARDLTSAIKHGCANLFSQVQCWDPLTDAKATRSAIIDALDDFSTQIAADPEPLKLGIISFSGHGIISKHQDFAFLPHDYEEGKTANLIDANEVTKRVDRLTCPVILILDACHSGQAALDIFARGSKATINNAELGEAVEEFGKQRAGLFVLTACQADQLAFENKAVWGHGALCKILLERLDPKASINRGKIVTLKDLNDWATKRVPELTQRATGSKSTVVPAFPPGRLPDKIPIAYFPPESGQPASPRSATSP